MNQQNNQATRCQYLYRHLGELQYLLHARGLVIGPDRWLAANDLLLHLQQNNHQLQNPEDLRNLLGPLFCRSVQEQNLFTEIFDLWAQEKQADLEQLGVIEPGTIELPVPEPKPFYSRLGFWAAILIVGLITLLNIEDKPPQPIQTQPINAPVDRTSSNSNPETCENKVERCDPKEELLPPVKKTVDNSVKPATFRNTPEPVRLNVEQLYSIARWQYVAVGLPLLLWLLFRLYRIANQRYVLRQEDNLRGNPLVYLKLKMTQSMPFALGDFSSKLRLSVLQSTRNLDADKTIIATIRNAGLFKPVSQQRYFQPEYLILIDRAHSNDQFAALADSLLTRLQMEHLHIHAFDFQGDPSWCFEINKTHAISLQSLAHKYADNRLIVISSGHKLVDKLTGKLADWVTIFEAWQQRVWLTNQPQPWGYTLSKIALSGFAVAPLESAGMKASAHWFAAVQSGGKVKSGVWYAGNLAQNFPAQLKDNGFWLESEAEKAHKNRLPLLIQQLREYLFDDGMQLLCCVAAYPEINGNLSIALEQKLFVNAQPNERERRLLKLSALPWCQQGQMPSYLRAALLDELSKSEFKHLGQIYRDLFELAGTGEQGLGIQVPGNSKPPKTDKPFNSHSYPTSDPLMIKALRGWRSRLDFVLPNQLARSLGKVTNSSWFSYVSFSSVVAVSLCLWFIWPYYQTYKENAVIDGIRLQNYNIGVIIETDSSNDKFSKALSDSLQRWGFQFTKINVDETASANKGQIITSDQAIGELVQARIEYLTNGQLKIDVSDEQNQPKLDLPEEFRQQVKTIVRVRLPTEMGQNQQDDSIQKHLQDWYAQRDFVFDLLQANRNDLENYNSILLTELRPRLNNLIVSELNWLLENNSVEQRPLALYEALKAYLMLHTPSKLNAGYVLAWLTHTLKWENAQNRERSLSYFSDLLSLELNGQTTDLNLVTSVRRKLAVTPTADLIYQEFKAATSNGEMYSLYEQIGAEKLAIFRLDDEVQKKLTFPIIFTKQGYLTSNFEDLVLQIGSDLWVLSDDTSVVDDFNNSEMIQTIKLLYAIEYGETWLIALDSLRIKDFSQYTEVRDVFKSLTTKQSSGIFRAIELVYINTKFDGVSNFGSVNELKKAQKLVQALSKLKPEDVLEVRLEQQFSALHKLVEDKSIYAAKIGEPVASIEDELALIYNSPSPDQQAFNRLKMAYGKNEPLFTSANRARSQKLPVPVDRWLISISDIGARLIYNLTRQHIAQNWQQVIQIYQQTIALRYPFDRNAEQDVTYQDLMAMFTFNGLPYTFGLHFFGPFVDTTGNRIVNKTLNGISLDFSQSFLQSAMTNRRLSDTLNRIRDNDDIEVRLSPYSLSPSVSQFQLDIYGQKLTYNHGPRREQSVKLQFINSIDYQQSDSLWFAFKDLKGSSARKDYKGVWAWFRFLQDANIQATRSRNLFRLTIKSTQTKTEQEMVFDLSIDEKYSEFVLGHLFEHLALPQNIFIDEQTQPLEQKQQEGGN